MSKVLEEERVKIWNTYFHEAISQAERVRDKREPISKWEPGEAGGGRLSDEEQGVLTLLILCALAIEARVNHLLEWLFDEGNLSRKTCDAALWLSTVRKWILLPLFAGKGDEIGIGTHPHRAVKEICDLRAELVHAKMKSRTEVTPEKAVELFCGFIEAIDDMNTKLGRDDQPNEELKKLRELFAPPQTP